MIVRGTTRLTRASSSSEDGHVANRYLLKMDLDELKDAIQDLEPDLSEIIAA